MNCEGAVTVLFDTDVLIWLERGNVKAAKLINTSEQRYMSVLTRMEWIQGAANKTHIARIESFISDYNFVVLPLTNDIGHRALVYIEEYALANGLRANDAIIAATAVENNLLLSSSNIKHYKPIKDLKFQPLPI